MRFGTRFGEDRITGAGNTWSEQRTGDSSLRRTPGGLVKHQMRDDATYLSERRVAGPFLAA